MPTRAMKLTIEGCCRGADRSARPAATDAGTTPLTIGKTAGWRQAAPWSPFPPPRRHDAAALHPVPADRRRRELRWRATICADGDRIAELCGAGRRQPAPALHQVRFHHDPPRLPPLRGWISSAVWAWPESGLRRAGATTLRPSQAVSRYPPWRLRPGARMIRGRTRRSISGRAGRLNRRLTVVHRNRTPAGAAETSMDATGARLPPAGSGTGA